MLRLKTAEEIEGDFYRFLKESALKEEISGDVYRFGETPDEEKEKENAFVRLLSGTDSLLQRGIISINVYIPDLIDDSGRHVANKPRISAIMTALRTFRDDFPCTDGYQLLTGDTDTSEQVDGIYSHVVHARIPIARRAS